MTSENEKNDFVEMEYIPFKGFEYKVFDYTPRHESGLWLCEIYKDRKIIKEFDRFSNFSDAERGARIYILGIIKGREIYD